MKTNDNYEVTGNNVIYVPSFDGNKFIPQKTETHSGVATGKRWYAKEENCIKECDLENKRNKSQGQL